MKKLILILSIVITGSTPLYAQWTTGTIDINNTNTGNVGIGTTSPAFPLHVQGTNGNYVAFDVNSNGNSKIKVTASGGAVDPGIVFTNSTGSLTNTISGNLTAGFYFDSGPGEYHFRNSNGTDRVTILSGGNVGIGTANPSSILHLSNGGPSIILDANTQGTDLKRTYIATSEVAAGDFVIGTRYDNNTVKSRNLYIANSGNVGIGTASPAGKLEVTGTVTAANYAHNKGVSFTGTLEEPTAGYYSAGVNSVPVFGNGSGTMADAMGMYTGGYTKAASTTVTNSYGLFVDNNTMTTTNSYGLFVNAPSGGATKNVAAYFGGNVGIGTTTPDTKLAVNGTIHSKEVKVDMNGWSDYVFEPNYDLPSLASVKTYIDKNHRLPEMPSTQEVLKNGINLGEIIKVQTKKIEELTLYLIEKDNKDKEKDARLQSQQAQINQLKEQLTSISKALNKN